MSNFADSHFNNLPQKIKNEAPCQSDKSSLLGGENQEKQTGTQIIMPLPYEFARKNAIIVLADKQNSQEAMQTNTLCVGIKRQTPATALLEVRRLLGVPLQVQTLSDEDFDQYLEAIYAGAGLQSSARAALDEDVELTSLVNDMPKAEDLLGHHDAPIIKLINGLMQEAIKLRASDVHIEPYEERLVARFRIDGVMREALSLPTHLSTVLAARIKVMARLDIAEKRLPQDGRFSLTLGSHALDVRVSTLPSRYGERVVMRILSKQQALLSVAQLGMDAQTAKNFTAALNIPNGVILITGPTGSGKTTTLYVALQSLKSKANNILTVEDPIEYALDGVGQTQINHKIGMTFAMGLRAILRQDPDIVMVGEIRDTETAHIAVQASLTGHLVLSSVHTNSAIAAVSRLRDMGLEGFLLASSLSAIMAQRLLRRLCVACKIPTQMPLKGWPKQINTLAKQMGIPSLEGFSFYQANINKAKCPHCHGLGYSGRVGIYELVMMSRVLKNMVHEDARESDLHAHAFQGNDTLAQNALRHAFEGTIALYDVLRICNEIDR